jgi:hypothetical protein
LYVKLLFRIEIFTNKINSESLGAREAILFCRCFLDLPTGIKRHFYFDNSTRCINKFAELPFWLYYQMSQNFTLSRFLFDSYILIPRPAFKATLLFVSFSDLQRDKSTSEDMHVFNLSISGGREDHVDINHTRFW